MAGNRIRTSEDVYRGVSYPVRYAGSVMITTSMKALDFDERSELAKECIARVCEATGFISVKKRKVNKHLCNFISEKPNLYRAGENVLLVISTEGFKLLSMDTNHGVISSHTMPNISFASGGDQETSDFVSYVAKDERAGRYCYVLECGAGQASDVISTIGRAFELRFRDVNENAPKVYANGSVDDSVTPDLTARTNPKQYMIELFSSTSGDSRIALVRMEFDFNAYLAIANYRPPSPQFSNVAGAAVPATSMYYNSPTHPTQGTAVRTPMQAGRTNSNNRDFDNGPTSESALHNHALLLREAPWYHNVLSREQSEAFIRQDGEFLVRRSPSDRNQFVLTGMQDGAIKHLLLMDDSGLVRTRDRQFDNVCHLIQYHRENSLPISSSESALVLRTPVNKRPS